LRFSQNAFRLKAVQGTVVGHPRLDRLVFRLKVLLRTLHGMHHPACLDWGLPSC
jgi:hypothetical protein